MQRATRRPHARTRPSRGLSGRIACRASHLARQHPKRLVKRRPRDTQCREGGAGGRPPSTGRPRTPRRRRRGKVWRGARCTLWPGGQPRRIARTERETADDEPRRDCNGRRGARGAAQLARARARGAHGVGERGGVVAGRRAARQRVGRQVRPGQVRRGGWRGGTKWPAKGLRRNASTVSRVRPSSGAGRCARRMRARTRTTGPSGPRSCGRSAPATATSTTTDARAAHRLQGGQPLEAPAISRTQGATAVGGLARDVEGCLLRHRRRLLLQRTPPRG